MTTTVEKDPAGNLATVKVDGVRVGTVVKYPHRKTFRATRREGTSADLRRIADGFRTIDAGVAWITLSIEEVSR